MEQNLYNSANIKLIISFSSANENDDGHTGLYPSNAIQMQEMLT